MLVLGILILLGLALLILLVLLILLLLLVLLLLLLLLFQQFFQFFKLLVVGINLPAGLNFLQGIGDIIGNIKLRAAVEKIIGALGAHIERNERGKQERATGDEEF